MAADWPIVTLNELQADDGKAIAIGPFGSKMKSSCYVATGVPVIRGMNISDTRVLCNDFVYITEQKADELKSCCVFADDLFFPHRGSIGEVGIVPEDGFERYVLSSSIMKLTCNRTVVEPLFLFYYFRSSEGRHEILRFGSTVGTPGIGQPLSSLKQMRVPLPPLPEQRAIASILGSLDDKIELNRRMNETLEGIARALFKSWFVDFDPVRAKMDGRQPAGMSPQIANLFPSEFEHVNGELVPKGWKTAALASNIELLSGGTPKTGNDDYWNGDIPWYTVKDAPNETDVWVIGTERNVSQKGIDNSAAQILPERTTIISARGTVGKLALTGVPMAMNQSCYGVIGSNGFPSLFTYFNLRAAVEELKQRTHGTVFDTITRQTFSMLNNVFPPVCIACEYDRKVDDILRRILSNLHESLTLSSLRDTLLPKLLSGELRVPEADKMLEEVL